MSNIEQTLSIIKPDAVERNLQDQIKNEFKKNGFEILKKKKYILQRKKQRNFIRYMSLNHFIVIYVHIYPLDQS